MNPNVPQANPAGDWSLHAQLAQDTVAIGDLPVCRVLAMNDANYPWLILVPRQPDAVEIIDLATKVQGRLLGEISRVSQALKTLTGCDKLNIAALGNVVPQLHVHVVARFKTDAAWPKPVWGIAPPKPYDTAARDAFVEAIRGALQLAGEGEIPRG